MGSIFCAFGRKRGLIGNFEKNFENIEKILKKIAKNELVEHILQKINKPCIDFLRVWTKNTHCREILKIF